METAIKIADARFPDNPAYLKCWLDGQLIEARDDGFKWGKKDKENFLILRTPDDFNEVRGGTDWKVWNDQAREFKKLFSATDSQDKQRWEFGFLKDEKPLRVRDHFLDIQGLLLQGLLTRTDWENLYAHGKESGIINIDRSLFDLVKNEKTQERTLTPIKNQGITSGTYQIGTGAGADYATWALFATDVNAGGQMDGDLTGEGQNEETAIAAYVTFDVDTNGNLLKITAESGAEHNGGAYGNGARIQFGTYDSIVFDETNDQDLGNIEISKLAMDISGAGNVGLNIADTGSGDVLINRVLVKGDGTASREGITVGYYCRSTNVYVRNDIIYSISSGYSAIQLRSYTGTNTFVYNNTMAKCQGNGLKYVDSSANHTAKNNLCQGNSTDYENPGYIDTSAKNISEDATSPDVAYRSKDVHTNSVFRDYDNDDYRLNMIGDQTNLAILAEGDDLSGTFTDDVRGRTRSTWYIGADEQLNAGTVLIIPGKGLFQLPDYEEPESAGVLIELVASILGATTTPTASLVVNRLLSAKCYRGNDYPG